MACAAINSRLRQMEKNRKSKKDNPKINHSKLVEAGAKWLFNKGYKVVLKELVTCSPEIPDCIGFSPAKNSFLIEAKASRSDFFQDKKKFFRVNAFQGVGTFRAFICEKGLIASEEVPENWGLIYLYENGRTRTIKPATAFKEKQVYNEKAMLISVIRRFIDGFEYKKYLHFSEFAEIPANEAPVFTGCESNHCSLRSPGFHLKENGLCSCLSRIDKGLASDIVDYISNLKGQILIMRNCDNCVRSEITSEDAEYALCLTCGLELKNWVCKSEKTFKG